MSFCPTHACTTPFNFVVTKWGHISNVVISWRVKRIKLSLRMGWRNHGILKNYTLAARGLEEPCVSFPDFCENCQFHVIYCVSSRLCIYFISKNFWFTIHVDSWFWRIIDWICWACAIFWIPNLQACTDRQTDRQIDRRTHRQTDGRTDSQTN